ncbi:MAG: ABC transporter ATP-binding protein [Treponema sp.]
MILPMHHLKIENISKAYGAKKALDAVTVVFGEGVTGLLGPNGAGKSTLMRIVSAIEKPDSGVVLYDGTDIGRKPNALRQRLGYLPQDFGVYPNMTAPQFLEYIAAMKNLPLKPVRKRIDELLDILHLGEAKKQLLGGFSGGMKQRVGIAQALLNDPEVLIADEPTVGLDPEERIRFRNLLASISLHKIVILSTHIVSDIESIAPSIVLLNGGAVLAQGEPSALIEKVSGKVWHCTVPIEELNVLQKRYRITSSIQYRDGIKIKVLSEKAPLPHAEPAESSLEDAYLFLAHSKACNI